MGDVWSDLHQNYKGKDWIDKPSIFAEIAVRYFPKTGKVLDLGAGQGQDSRFFAEHGYQVVSTDLENSALELSKSKVTDDIKSRITFQKVDLRDELPFETDSLDVVYAHLSIHYFEYETTVRLLDEILRVLRPGGVFAFLTNSVNDPEYKTGKELEPDYYQIGQTAKRYFSVDSARMFTQYFEVNLLDDLGETYKDAAKGVHNLIRFVGKKRRNPEAYKMAIPCTGAIVERDNNGVKEVLLQTRWQPNGDPLYSGTLEFPIGKLDMPFENIFETIAREIKEETGLTLKAIKDETKTKVYSPQGSDEIIAFRPFCCTQQLKNGRPWVSYIFIAEVENGEPKAQLSEAKDSKWVPVNEVKDMFDNNPEKLFGLQLPAWEYYFQKLI